MTDVEIYLLQLIPVITLGLIYGVLGFELAVVMGIAMIWSATASPTQQ